MLRTALLLSLLPAVALAQPKAPPTIVLPTDVVATIGRYLETRPYSEVGDMVNELRACLSAQIPDATGAITDKGQCPPVTKALKPDTPAKAMHP